MTTPETHPFAHLGPAPYRFVGLETTDDRQAANAYRAANGLPYTTNLCGGSSEYEGTKQTELTRVRMTAIDPKATEAA